MAAIAGTTQATVSRWECGELKPDIEQLSRIRSEAMSRGIEWDDGWLFRPAEVVPERVVDDAPRAKRRRGKAA